MNRTLYAFTIFLSAFLVFFIQPLLAKSLLPTFGGSIFVWVVSMLFFQFGLLTGYSYAYVLSLCRVPLQVIVHFLLLTISFYFISNALPTSYEHQTGWPPFELFKLLSAKILLPFILLSSTSPLLQSWYCKIEKTDFPYYYYSISNAGSLIGLFCFPLFFEWWLGLDRQMMTWNVLYITFASACFFCSLPLLKATPILLSASSEANKSSLSTILILKWLGLTILSSAFMLASSNYILQNIINMPLIWILPLALYLITFIITFAKPKKYQRNFWALSTAIWLALLSWAIYRHEIANNFLHGSIVVLALMYSVCMVCHGELIQLKPSTKHLTLFYLIMSIGGILGGLFVTIGGYWLFNDLWDYYIPLSAAAIICIILLYKEYQQRPTYFHLFTFISCLLSLGFFITIQLKPLWDSQLELVAKKRNAYGLIRVEEFKSTTNPQFNQRRLMHGPIIHGMQYLDLDKRSIPTSYYGMESGVGYALSFLQSINESPLKIAVIGLGTGTIATLADAGDELHFYDIDENIIEVSKSYFTFLNDSPAKHKIFLGDGRIEMQKLLNTAGSQHYDLIVLDAFNGDSIPFHLMTQEAMTLYRQHLKAGGIIAFHISNKFMDLKPVTKALANLHSFLHFSIITPGDRAIGTFSSSWTLLSGNLQLAVWIYEHKPEAILHDKNLKPILWTDNFNSMLPLFTIAGG